MFLLKSGMILLQEGEQVIAGDVREVAVKFTEGQTCLAMPMQFQHQYQEALLNIDFANFVEGLGNKIKGPIILHFPSLTQRLQRQPQQIHILQQTILPCPAEYQMQFGGCMMLSCYHIGSHESLGETYQKMLEWAERHQYFHQDECYERCVTDYWTTRDSGQFVTELLIPVQRKQKE